MKPRNKFKNTLNKIEQQYKLKSRYTRMLLKIAPHNTLVKLNQILNNQANNSDIEFTRHDAYIIIAILIELGILRFFKKQRRSKNFVDFGIDIKVWNKLTNINFYFEKNNYTIRPIPETSPWHWLFINLHPYIKHISATAAIIEKPSTLNLDKIGKIKFSSPLKQLLYHMASIIEEVNNGHYGTSLMIESIQNHLMSPAAKHKPLNHKRLLKMLKSKQHVVSDEEIEKFSNSKNIIIPEIELPDIRPEKPTKKYQWSGVNWILAAKRGVLAFDVGLGKTRIMTLATYIAQKKGLADGAIIFTMKNIVSDFVKEIKKVWPEAKIVTLNTTKEKREMLFNAAMQADFIISTYGPLARDMPEVDEIFNNRPNAMIFFDEGSRIKNLNTNIRAKAEQLIENREFVIIADATPMPNDILHEAFSLINFCRPGQLGTMRAWRKIYGNVKYFEKDGKVIPVYSQIDKIKKAIEPFIYVKKRTDADVDVEMPPEPNQIDKYFDMGPRQIEYYKHAEARTLDAIVDTLSPGNQNFKRAQHIFTQLLRQRMVAVTPWLVDETYNADEERLELVAELVNKWLLSEDSPIIIGSEFVKYYPRLRQRIIKKLNSNSLSIADDQIRIFTGQTTLKKADEIKQGLNSGTIKVALMGYKSAGAGINIQEKAHRVILVHKPWNPALVTQFVGRVNRNGQKNIVDIISIIAAYGIDNYVEDKLFRKSYEQDTLLTGQELKLGQNVNELIKMAGFSIDEIKQRALKRGVQLDNATLEQVNEKA